MDINIFFPASKKEADPAIEICSRCPVMKECLYFALQSRSFYGVWGGIYLEGLVKERRRKLDTTHQRTAERIREILRVAPYRGTLPFGYYHSERSQQTAE